MEIFKHAFFFYTFLPFNGRKQEIIRMAISHVKHRAKPVKNALKLMRKNSPCSFLYEELSQNEALSRLEQNVHFHNLDRYVVNNWDAEEGNNRRIKSHEISIMLGILPLEPLPD